MHAMKHTTATAALLSLTLCAVLCAPAQAQTPAATPGVATPDHYGNLGGLKDSNDATFVQLGGKEGIDKIITAFLPLLKADPRIKEKFKDTNMELLGRQLASQFCELTGGPCHYGGDDMKMVHGGMQINNLQFNALAEDLQIAMEQQGIPFAVQNRLVAKLAPMQRAIVTK